MEGNAGANVVDQLLDCYEGAGVGGGGVVGVLRGAEDVGAGHDCAESVDARGAIGVPGAGCGVVVVYVHVVGVEVGCLASSAAGEVEGQGLVEEFER